MTEFALKSPLFDDLQSAFSSAREGDERDLLSRLSVLSNDEHKLLDAIRFDGTERFPIPELAVAFSKVLSAWHI